MYTIIGGDGKEYGPVSAEQVRAWIAAGRANMGTKVKAVGTDTWRTIAEVPEITSPAAPAAPGAPSAPPVDFDIVSCYARSWDLLKANFWPMVGVNFLILILFAIIGAPQFFGIFFVSPLFGGIIAGGLYYYVLLKVRGQPASVGDAFAGFRSGSVFLNLLVAGLLIAIFTTLGLLLIILPGIYLMIAYLFTSLLCVDRKLGFWDAMECSRKAVTAKWWHILGVVLLGIPFILLGILALGVGIFVAMPLVTGAFVYAYEDLFGRRS